MLGENASSNCPPPPPPSPPPPPPPQLTPHSLLQWKKNLFIMTFYIISSVRIWSAQSLEWNQWDCQDEVETVCLKKSPLFMDTQKGLCSQRITSSTFLNPLKSENQWEKSKQTTRTSASMQTSSTASLTQREPTRFPYPRTGTPGRESSASERCLLIGQSHQMRLTPHQLNGISIRTINVNDATTRN